MRTFTFGLNAWTQTRTRVGRIRIWLAGKGMNPNVGEITDEQDGLV